MKSQLRKLEDSALTTDKKMDDTKVKTEPDEAFYSQYNRGSTRGRSFQRGGYRGGTRRSGRGRGILKETRRQGNYSLNPEDRDGRPTRCYICKSVYHWANECSVKTSEERYEKDAESNIFP